MKKSIATIAVVVLAVAGITTIASASSAKQAGMSDKNIVQTAVAAGQFKTLVSLSSSRLVSPALFRRPAS